MTKTAKGADGFSPAPNALSGGPTSQGEEPKIQSLSSDNLQAARTRGLLAPTGLDSELVKAFQGPAQVGAYRTQDHRYYWQGQGPIPSVTTVLDVIHRWAVTEHIAKETARAILTDPGSYFAQVPVPSPQDRDPVIRPPDDVEEAIKRARKQADKARDDAASIGTGVHHYADIAARSPQDGPGGFEPPPEYIPYIEAWRRFLDRYSASSIVSSEKMVFGHGYAGTYDLLMMLPKQGVGAGGVQVRDQELWLIDIKTGRGYYPEHGLQLAAYGHAEYIGLEQDPQRYPMPHVSRYGVLHLRPDQYPDTGWRLIEYPVTDRDYVAFLGALELYQWQQERRFTKSILQKAVVKGEVNGIREDPLTVRNDSEPD